MCQLSVLPVSLYTCYNVNILFCHLTHLLKQTYLNICQHWDLPAFFIIFLILKTKCDVYLTIYNTICTKSFVDVKIDLKKYYEKFPDSNVLDLQKNLPWDVKNIRHWIRDVGDQLLFKNVYL